MKILSNLERNRRKYQKQLKSLSNKMHGVNEIWWKSLSQNAQYALLFRYTQEKNLLDFKFKRFIEKYKPKFIPLRINSRNVIIEHLFKD